MSRIEEVRPPDPWPAPPTLLPLSPTQGDYERAKDKARQLLKYILPKNSWKELEETGVFQITGKRGIYFISSPHKTEIRDLKSGRTVAYACLQMTIPAPTYDRMVAEYLLIKNDEDFYWKTANIFSRTRDDFCIGIFFFIAVDIVLFASLFLEILRISR